MFLRASVLLLLTAAAALAGAVSDAHRRDFNLIQTALNNLNALLRQIDDSILALNTDNITTQGSQILMLGKTVLPSLSGVNAQIQASQPLTLDETLSLNAARTALNQNINLTVNDLIAKKPIFDMANTSSQIADTLQQIRDSSGMFFTVVQTKLAPGAPDLQNLFANALNVFDTAIGDFRGQTITSNPAAAAPAAATVNGTGILNADGSCICAVTCPAGSFPVMASV